MGQFVHCATTELTLFQFTLKLTDKEINGRLKKIWKEICKYDEVMYLVHCWWN